MCVLGKRLLKDIHITNCTKNPTGELHKLFCPNNTCDPYYSAHNVSVVQGIKVFLHFLIFVGTAYHLEPYVQVIQFVGSNLLELIISQPSKTRTN